MLLIHEIKSSKSFSVNFSKLILYSKYWFVNYNKKRARVISDGYKELNYHVSNIKRELTKEMDISTYDKVVRLFKDKFQSNVAIPVSDIKKEVQEIYNTLGIKRTAKATDIKEWCYYDSKAKNINNKNTVCIIINEYKIVRLQ